MPDPSPALPLGDLVGIARDLVEQAETWSARVRHDPQRRYFERIAATEAYDAWVVGWAPGQGVAAHEHGGSAGVVRVAEGRLLETRFDSRGQPLSKLVAEGDVTAIGSEVVHALGNIDDAPATSVHVYSPPLRSMGFVQGGFVQGGFVQGGFERGSFEEGPDVAVDDSPVRVEPVGVWRESSHPANVDALLHGARRQLDRVDPHEALAALHDGALLVDTRPASFRRAEGVIPGAVVVERNVLEWRLDPASPYRIPEITGHDQRIILFCNEGFASSLAAVSLHSLGLGEATDLIGGYRAWRLAGLPTVRAVEDSG